MIMKRNIIFLFVAALILLPFDTKATTLKEYEDAVAKYTKELQEKEAQVAKNDAEVAAIKNKMVEIEKQIQQTQTEVTRIEQEIEESNKKIAEKSEESKKIMEYFQISNGENAYLEYAFGAESITDMVYRMSVVEQLTEYNDNLMKELETLVSENTAKKKELTAKNKELKALKVNLEEQKKKIDADTAAVKETMPSVKEQISTYQKQVDYWKGKGCKSNDVLGVTCAVPPKVTTGGGSTGGIIGANGFRMPMDKGYLTQGYVGYGGHLGLDFSSSNKSEPIYPIANGQVIYSGKDVYGALVVKIVHNVNGKLIFSTYAHMRTVYLQKGQIVTPSTTLGLMGSTGWSTGPHLHIEMSTCDWTYNCTYSQYLRTIISPWGYIPKLSRW